MRRQHLLQHPAPFRLASAALLVALSGCAEPNQAPEASETAVKADDIQISSDRLSEAYRIQQRELEEAAARKLNARENHWGAQKVFPAPPDDYAQRDLAQAAPDATAAEAASEPASDAEFVGPPAPAPDKPAEARPVSQTREPRSVDDFLGLLAQRPGAKTSPMAEALRLAVLDSIDPGVADIRFREAAAKLDPAQMARLESFRSLLRTFQASDDASAADLARALRDEAAGLLSSQGLKIPTAALVRKVEAFGRYTPFADNRFLVGRAQPALVYVEVEDYGFKAIGNDSEPQMIIQGARAADQGQTQWAIELTEELCLYHDADSVLAWHWPEQPSRDVSRRKRTDHYLIQRIELPASLTIGAYNLKVILKDQVTGGRAEALIPIQIVADPKLAQTGAPTGVQGR